MWKILEPTASPVKLDTLRGKVLAIDASIWIYHFLKAMRDPKGTILTAAHIIGFFRRICKLMFFEIRPVFVFDGAAPVLKKQTTNKRSERRIGREINSRATANKLLTLQLQRAAAHAPQEEATQNIGEDPEVTGSVPENAVYFDELQNRIEQKAPQTNPAKPFVKMDQYHLPDMQSIGPLRADDQRLLTQDELDEYSNQLTSQARGGFIDTSLVDFNSRNFELLPLETQYQLLNMARLKSRLRMGYTADELNKMFPNEMDFSKFQINRVAQRNFFTQRLMTLSGFEEDLTRRVSSEKGKEYLLKRTDQGWSLALEDRDKLPESHSESQSAHKVKEDSDSDAEFEDIDLAPSAKEYPRTEQTESHQPDGNQPQAFDITKEESSKLDELFGFEAQLSREDLYSKLMDQIVEDDEPIESFRPAKSGKSVLFGESKTPTSPVDSNDSKGPEEKAPPVPWFEQQNNDFENMDINQEREVPNFIPIDEYQHQSSESEEENLERELPESSSVLFGFRDTPQKEKTIAAAEPRASENTAGAAPCMNPISRDEDTNVAQSEGVSVNRMSEATQEFNKEASSPLAESDAADTQLNESENGDQEPVGQLAGPSGIEHVQTKAKKSEKGDKLSSEDSQPIIELSADAAERAEKEAIEDQEEDEDIAVMLITEAEENERFAREIAEQTRKGWTDEDQREYESQINDLRLQFSKQTRDADTVSNEMIQECQELLQLFGIPYITAPAEAEAQCAELRQLHLVDGVVTDDGDTFLFDKSAVVYRNMFNQSKFVEFYSAKQIEDRLGLSRRHLIELAFLLGSDYTEGIVGIGPVTGVELLAEFGSLKAFAEWWQAAQRFPDSVDVDTSLKRRLLKQFKSKLFLPEDFPSKHIVDAYLNPAVDKDPTKFSWGSPDIDGLRKFMASTAGWTLDKTNTALLPVVQEAKRQDLLRKTEQAYDQTSLDDFYKTIVQNPELNSKRAAKAATTMRKRAKNL